MGQSAIGLAQPPRASAAGLAKQIVSSSRTIRTGSGMRSRNSTPMARSIIASVQARPACTNRDLDAICLRKRKTARGETQLILLILSRPRLRRRGSPSRDAYRPLHSRKAPAMVEPWTLAYAAPRLGGEMGALAPLRNKSNVYSSREAHRAINADDRRGRRQAASRLRFRRSHRIRSLPDDG